MISFASLLLLDEYLNLNDPLCQNFVPVQKILKFWPNHGSAVEKTAAVFA